MIINVGVAGVGCIPRAPTATLARGDETPDPAALLDTREVHFVVDNRAVAHATRFIARDRLQAGNRIAGPAVIEQSDTTTILGPTSVADVDEYGNLIVRFNDS